MEASTTACCSFIFASAACKSAFALALMLSKSFWCSLIWFDKSSRAFAISLCICCILVSMSCLACMFWSRSLSIVRRRVSFATRCSSMALRSDCSFISKSWTRPLLAVARASISASCCRNAVIAISFAASRCFWAAMYCSASLNFNSSVAICLSTFSFALLEASN